MFFVLAALFSTQLIADEISGGPRVNFDSGQLIVPCVEVDDPGSEFDGRYFDAVLNKSGNSYELIYAEEEDDNVCEQLIAASLNADANTSDVNGDLGTTEGGKLTSAPPAIKRGINYDPAHSSGFTEAQKANNLEGMKNEIIKDLEIIKRNGFNDIKTFFSSFSTIDGKETFTIAELACPRDLHLTLGVFEFDPEHNNCASWCETATEIQVQKAIESAQNFPDCIKAIAVGNEDIYNYNFTQPKREMQKRIAKDIATIKQQLGNSNTLVGSAQQDGAWLKLINDDPNKIISKLDFVGVNIYPFWSSHKPSEQESHEEFTTRYSAIVSHPQLNGKKIIVTEEGWPSKSDSGQNPNASIESQKNYYNWWTGRANSDSFDSFYFSIFDKQPLDNDADKYFGLCTYDRKAKILTQCN